MKPIISIMVLLVLFGCHNTTAQPVSLTQNSVDNRYRATLSSQLTPLQINQIHAWQLDLATAEGQSVVEAVINFDGGMPEHNHGFPTAPVVSEVGNGIYLIEGVKFQMGGMWQMTFDVEANGYHDRLIFDVMVP